MINKSFVIYGERNSGTNYLETILTGQSYHISSNMPAFDCLVLNPSRIDMKCKYGHKHFFGFYDKEIQEADTSIVFIGIVRNPYDWIKALNNGIKHHIPPKNYPMLNFLSNQWYSIDHDPESPTYGNELLEDRDFETGLRYENIFKIRSKKLRYLYHTMPTIAKNYEFIKYEDLCSDPWSFVTHLSLKYNIPLKMPILEPIIKDPYYFSCEIKQIIDDNIDWDIENEIGYFIR